MEKIKKEKHPFEYSADGGRVYIEETSRGDRFYIMVYDRENKGKNRKPRRIKTPYFVKDRGIGKALEALLNSEIDKYNKELELAKELAKNPKPKKEKKR